MFCGGLLAYLAYGLGMGWVEAGNGVGGGDYDDYGRRDGCLGKGVVRPVDVRTPSVEVTNLAAPVTPWSDEDVLMGILGVIKGRSLN